MRVEAAFNTTGYSLVSDNEHVMYLSPATRDALPTPTSAKAAAAAAKKAATAAGKKAAAAKAAGGGA